ncbi:hypothetical protein BSU04_02010 [Caballeronia sordidicola]|uniref:Uncharacterized protein n=1 Tax=Caballeronia sordidicola TaxID=196367 RepID=A0A226XC25_CABSO|nr:hypothetical protein BSU04_02010 [Caballeronia sordidicola]
MLDDLIFAGTVIRKPSVCRLFSRATFGFTSADDVVCKRVLVKCLM